ncbi:MAG: TonB family protein [Flavobacteriales bacterium]|nr:TonB family protein [Flavobacteriales bacterium]
MQRKTIIFFFALFGTVYSNTVAGQDTTAQEVTEMTVSNMPDNHEAIEKQVFKTLAENLKYPELAKSEKIGGIVYVQFIVSKTGELRDFEVVHGVREDIDREALRVAKLLTSLDWKPSTDLNGKPLDTFYTVPVTFEP